MGNGISISYVCEEEVRGNRNGIELWRGYKLLDHNIALFYHLSRIALTCSNSL